MGYALEGRWVNTLGPSGVLCKEECLELRESCFSFPSTPLPTFPGRKWDPWNWHCKGALWPQQGQSQLIYNMKACVPKFYRFQDTVFYSAFPPLAPTFRVLWVRLNNPRTFWSNWLKGVFKTWGRHVPGWCPCAHMFCECACVWVQDTDLSSRGKQNERLFEYLPLSRFSRTFRFSANELRWQNWKALGNGIRNG